MNRFFLIFGIIGSLLMSSTAQDIRNTENSVDYSKKSNLTVDPVTLAFQLQIPLGSYKQRNGELPVTLNYSSKVWQIKKSVSPNSPMTWCGDDPYNLFNAVYSQMAGWSSNIQGISVSTGSDYYNNAQQPADTGITKTVARMFVSLPDGTSHELRKDDTVYSGTVTSFTGKYYSVDGSRLIYDKDNSILYLPDGSRYSAGILTDSQGNKMSYSTSPTVSVTDTLGRVIDNPVYLTYADADATYSVPGFSTGTVDYQFHWGSLSDTGVIDSSETDQTLKYEGDATGGCSPILSDNSPLFSSDDLNGQLVLKTGDVFDPKVLTEIELPNGQTYTFKYNVYGEVVRIIYPTGGYERFQYAPVAGISGWFDDDFFGQANRGVVNRWLSPDGTSGSEMQFSYSASGAGVRLVTNPDGTSTEYRFTSRPTGETLSYGFDNPLNGKINEVRQYSSTGALMSRSLTEWTTDGTVTGSGVVAYKLRDPRVVREISVVFEPGSTNALASMTTTEYDSNTDPEYFANLNVKRRKTYDYVVVTASTASSASLATATGWFSGATAAVVNEFDYLYDSNYKARNMNSLVTESRIQDASGNVKAKTHFTYDEVGTYPIISAGTNAQWSDPSTNYRGYATTVRTWSDVSGNQYIDTHAQYDNFGNLRKAWDGNGNLTQTDYSSTYGYAYVTSETTPVPDSTGTNGSSTAFTSSTAYDFNTALPTSTSDINGATTTISYADPITSTIDPLLRVRKVTAPNGQQTITEYGLGISASTRWVKVKTQIDSSNWSEAVSSYDGIGRTVLTEKTDAHGNVFTETEYDANGRVKRSSNPYKSGETKKWTTPGYDNFGRPITTTTADSSVVTVSYGLSTSGTIGVTKTVTDQAGRKRKGITNALGQMIRVIEDPDISALVTDYVFDLLGNLRKTTQGDQNRYFMYDALGRLLFAKQPEQDTNSSLTATDPVTGNTAWSAKYVYDANSNITTTTGARNQSITATYDKLNRITFRDYSDSGMPDVSFYYDGTGLGSIPNYSKGKTTKVTSSISETRNTSFDEMGRLLTSEQRTDGVTYPFEYTYNLSGAITEEKYPSGRVVKNALNADGELARVESKKNATSGPFHTYASNFVYNAAGAVTKMELGNGRWETAVYDTDRLQVTQIGLGTTGSTQDLLKLEFKYNTPSTADNNGSMREQKITVPTVGSNPGFTATQTYVYDDLNRLYSAEEKVSGSTTWKQTFAYDRYGNRRFNTSGTNTTTLGSCSTAVCNPTFPTDSTNRNRFSSGQGYSYDANGNLTVDADGKQFFYDAENHQTEVKDSGNNSLGQYLYDGDGKRVKKIVGSEVTVFVYDASGQLAAEYSTQIEAPTTARVSYLTTDHLGSPRVITDKNGAVTSRKDFTAFGEAVTSSQRVSGSSGNGYDPPNVRQDYTGHEKDAESGLEYAQARYYNPQHGRFTSVDPLTASATIRDPQTLNTYSYALNSPYKFNDPLGLYAMRLPGDLCGGRGCRPPDSGVYFETRFDFTFVTFDRLSEKQQALLMGLWKITEKAKAAEAWTVYVGSTDQNKERAATFLANSKALSRMTLDLGNGEKINALDMVTRITGDLRQDRFDMDLNKAIFEKWQKAGGSYTMALGETGEKIEFGKVQFNTGGLVEGGSLHVDENGKPFDVQGHTNGWLHHVQLQYRFADGHSEVDIDYALHTNFDNSRVIKHYNDYVKKFGNPGFTVKEIKIRK